MTLIIIGPVTKDLIIRGSEKSYKVGGATFFQSFVFEEFYQDYLAIVNCADEQIADDFPDSEKVRIINKDKTHFYINEYPDEDNLDLRFQTTNFAEIPIFPDDLKDILDDVYVTAFVLNPLNRFDFPDETIEYIKSFNVPVYISIQGFLRIPGSELNGNYAIKLDNFDKLSTILEDVSAIFMDEGEANIIGYDYDVDEIVITDGSHGSRIISDHEIKIKSIDCGDIVDATGCGDTYMAAYVSQRLSNKSIKESADFASRIASKKLACLGPYNFNI